MPPVTAMFHDSIFLLRIDFYYVNILRGAGKAHRHRGFRLPQEKVEKRGSKDHNMGVGIPLWKTIGLSMKRRVVFYTILWLLAWCVGWGGFYLLLSRNINYISRPDLTALYFSLATLAIVFLSGDVLRVRRDLLHASSFMVPGLTLGVGVAVYVTFPLLLSPPWPVMAKNPDMFFLQFSLRYLVSKLFDISFQQMLVLLLILLLRRAGLSMKGTCCMCCLLFGAPHLYLIDRNGIALGGYFLAFSLLAGLLFPYMILRFRRGLAYTFSLHLLFYVVTGALCWLLPSVL